MQLFPDAIRKLWNGWEVRVMISLSLLLQIILIGFGSPRKYVARTWIRVVVWSAYLTADWVATVALGILANNSGESKHNSSKSNNVLHSFWAPFLLLHLGGPDTITAYSLEDNNLWLRHFLGLFVQSGVAFYVFTRSRSSDAFTFLAIPVFVTGIIKYGERTWVLWSSSTKQFRDSFLSDPDPGPDYVRYVETFETTTDLEDNPDAAAVLQREEIDPRADSLPLADYLFKRFRYLFADLILGYYDRIDCYRIIHDKSPKDAFELIAIELGFMYDVLYTKATAAYSLKGIILRFISFFSSMSLLISFFLFIDKNAYPLIDITITYMLIIGALLIDIYGFIQLFFSDWTRLWLIKLKNPHADLIRGVSYPILSLTNCKRWSGSMAQYSLIKSCFNPVKCEGIQEAFCIHEALEKHHYRTRKDIDSTLLELIFNQLLEKAKKIEYDKFNLNLCKQLMSQKDDSVLERYGLKRSEWYTINVEFDHSLLLWHIATDLCYYDEVAGDGERDKKVNHFQISKCLSDYMLYLLVCCPSMLPKGIGEIRYRDTRDEVKRFVKGRRILPNEIVGTCKALLEEDNISSLEKKQKGHRSQSVLLKGRMLAKKLKLLEYKEGWTPEKKWEMISEVWVEMLTYAASRCEWKEHGQQLRRGGELLTHVCLLMAHLGLSEQYQIQKDSIYRPESSLLEELLSNRFFQCLVRCALWIRR